MTAMANSKVQLSDGTVLLDLTGDTVAADKMVSGYTAHDKSGNQVTGNVTFATVYTGSGEPSSSLGEEGDLYFDLG